MEQNRFFVSVVRPVGLLVAFLMMVALAGLVGYEVWLQVSGQAEVRRLELEARVAEAEAARLAAEADRDAAAAVRAPAEAAARSVDRQSFILAWWGILSPGFVVLLCLISGVGGGAVGVGMAWFVLSSRRRWRVIGGDGG